MKRTYQPSKLKKARQFGYSKRKKAKFLKKRRAKERMYLIPL